MSLYHVIRHLKGLNNLGPIFPQGIWLRVSTMSSIVQNVNFMLDLYDLYYDTF